MRKFQFPHFSARRADARGVSRIAVFLGNPGAQYENTRHNAGFMVAAEVERKTGARINKLKFRSLTATAELGGERVLLLKPQTFMNLSGEAAREAMSFYKLPLDRVIVVSDDIALGLGALRIRRSGSSGGHNGLRDIIAKCGGEEFTRVRIGVGAPPDAGWDVIDWVMSRFDNADMAALGETLTRAVSAIETIISSGADAAMNTFNRT